jgi:hypothetical protein
MVLAILYNSNLYDCGCMVINDWKTVGRLKKHNSVYHIYCDWIPIILKCYILEKLV